MLSTLLSLLVFIIICGLVYWLVTVLPIPEPFRTIAIVLVVVILLFFAISYLGGGRGWAL